MSPGLWSVGDAKYTTFVAGTASHEIIEQDHLCSVTLPNYASGARCSCMPGLSLTSPHPMKQFTNLLLVQIQYVLNRPRLALSNCLKRLPGIKIAILQRMLHFLPPGLVFNTFCLIAY